MRTDTWGTGAGRADTPAGERRLLFVNEDIGGHRSMHLHIRQALSDQEGVFAEFLDVPRPGAFRRLVAAPIPGLAERDLDLQPLRYQLAQSAWVHAQLRRLLPHYDVVHLYTQNVALLSSGYLRHKASVVSIDATGAQAAYLLPYRRPTEHTEGRVRVGRVFEERVYDAATLIVAQSRWAVASLRDTYGIPEERLRVIPFGVWIGQPAVRHEPDALPEVTFTGTTLERKGGRLLLRAFHNYLRGRCTLNLITHESFPPRPGVRVFSDLVPGDPRLQEILSRTAVFAFPSEMDTFGYAILEAMAAGVPVVATPTAAIPEIVVDGETGLLVDADVDALGQAISRLLDDAALRRRMGESARARVREHFDARVTTRQLLGVLDEARERSPRRGARAPF